MLKPILSLTLEHGSIISSLAATRPTHPSATLFKYTNGVFPINSVTSLAILEAMIQASLNEKVNNLDPNRFEENGENRLYGIKSSNDE
jgi:hypothetical protein